MGRTPDRYPGIREEEGILLTDSPSAPSDPYSLARVDGDIEGVDSVGTFNPRDGDTLKGLDVSSATPDDDDVLTWNGTQERWEPQPTQPPPSSEETRTNTISTGSGTPQDAGGMSITLDAGSYVAWFSATGEASGSFGILAIDLALGGTSVDYSERLVETPKKNYSLSIATHARFTATQGQVLTGRYWNDGSGNVSLTQRTLTVIRVG